MGILLTIVAVIIGIYGLVRLIGGDILIGIILIVVACAVGPIGWSVFD